MEKETLDQLARIVREVRVVAAAVVDDAGMPMTRVVDMLDVDAEGLYFALARTEGFYAALAEKKALSFTGMMGEEPAARTTVSVQGRVEELGSGLVLPLFEKNPGMLEAYPTESSRENLTVFRVYQGSGAWAEAAQGETRRTPLRFGDERFNAKNAKRGYFITDECDGCRACVSKCPEGCIDVSMVPAVIDQERCTRCGNCEMACFQEAIVRME